MNKKLIVMAVILFISSISYTGFSSGESGIQGEGDIKEVEITYSRSPEGLITYGFTRKEVQTIQNCLNALEEQVKILRLKDAGKEAAELEDHIRVLKLSKFTKGSGFPFKTVYGYVYSTFDPQHWIYLTDDFFKLNEDLRTDPRWQKLTLLEQASVLIHEEVHANIQSFFQWSSEMEKEAYTMQYKWLKLFMEKNDYWKNFKEAQVGGTSDTTMVDDVKRNLKKYGVLKYIGTTTELDKALLNSQGKFDAFADRQRYESLERKWNEELPQFPTGADSRDIKKIEEWRDECLKRLDPKKDAARLANQDDCWSEVNRVHKNNDMLYCRTCKQITKQYWIQSDSDLGPHWMCQCSTVTQIADLTRPDGKTYRQYAKERIDAVNKMRQEKEEIASKVIQQIKMTNR